MVGEGQVTGYFVTHRKLQLLSTILDIEVRPFLAVVGRFVVQEARASIGGLDCALHLDLPAICCSLACKSKS